MQDLWMLLRLDNTSWRKTLQIFHNFMQWHVVNTLFQEMKSHHHQKDGSKGTPKIRPVLEVTTCYLHGKHGVEIRIRYLNRYNSHSWVRISHGTNKFVMNLSNIEQEIPEVQLEEKKSKLDAKHFACRSKAKAKPQRREPAGSSPRTVPIEKRTWTDVERGQYLFSDFEVSKKLIHLLRHGTLPRDNDGAIEFWRIKDNLQKHFLYCHHWSDRKWKSSMAGGGGEKKKIQYCFDSSGTILYLRALQGHSGRSLIDPSLQDNVIIPDGFFKYIHHVGCAINLHSIVNSGLIPGGQNLSNRQTVFFLPVDPMDKEHKDPDVIDLSVPRRAQYLHKAWKRHQDSVYGVDINLAIEKGLKFYQTRSNAIILHETLPAYCIPKAGRMETGVVIYEKVICVTSTYSKDFLETWLDERFGFRSCSTTRRRCWATSKKFPNQANQIQTQIMIERWNLLFALKEERPTLRTSRHVLFVKKLWDTIEREKPVFAGDENHGRQTVVCSEQAYHPRFSREGQNLIFESEINHDRKEKPLVCPQEGAPQTRFSRDSTNFNVEDETNHDRKGKTCCLPWCKSRALNVERSWHRLQNTWDCHIPLWNKLITLVFVNLWRRSRTTLTDNLFNEIYNKNNAYTPFRKKSKKMIKDMGNVELFELLETEPKNAMQRVLIVLEIRHYLLHMRASLEWKWSHPRHHSMYIGPCLNSKLCSLRRENLMATDMGKPQNKGEYYVAHNFEKEMHQEALSRDPSSFCERSWFSCISTRTWSRWRGSVSRWTSLRKKISPIIWRKQNTFDTEGIGGFLSIMTEHLDDWKIVLTFQRGVVYLTPSTPRIWRTTTQASAILEVSILAPIIEFFLQVGGNGAIPGGAHSNNSNESPHTSNVQSHMIEHGNLLFAVFLDQP